MDERKRVLPMRSSSRDSYGYAGLRIGKVVGIDERGQVLVDHPVSDQGHTAARLTSSAREKLLNSSSVGREVLLALDDDSGCPIIIDTLHSPVDETVVFPDCLLQGRKPETIEVDRKRVILDAEEEVVIRCGEASITLTSAGKVLIKGNYLVSRSSGTNSIKGSSVRIN